MVLSNCAIGAVIHCRKPFGLIFRRNKKEIGWGGRIRTFTVLINSEVSYQLDHAPAGGRAQGGNARIDVNFAEKQSRSIYIEYHGESWRQTARLGLNLDKLAEYLNSLRR
jgi:hypothetical protein